METKKKSESEEKPNFLGDLITGLAESFFRSQRPSPEMKQGPKVERQVEKEKEAPINISTTYIIFQEQPRSKGFLKRLIGLFW
jgi:hypothetical protein